ncbi:hypothetical protein DESC_720110 [Desulfosarcina cetonica]|nr:hypothetical protein DESC_720110 [Desulfosarcina cetonica]
MICFFLKGLPRMFCSESHPVCHAAASAGSPCGGMPTLPSCPACGNRYRPGSHFCDQCGIALRPERIPDRLALKGERKQVAVLFADISGYDDIIQQIDPEDLREVTRPIFQGITKIVAHYDGGVDRMLWDGVMAVFGMLQTHEDDAVRAVRAALDIQRMVAQTEGAAVTTIGRPLAMRFGIACGLVVSGAVQTQSGRYGLTGDAVNLAARLRDLAAPGEVLVARGVFSMTAGFFRFEASLPVTIKGREEPMAVFRLRSAAPQPQKVRRIHGVRTRLIGRDPQLKRMQDAVLRLRRGQGTVLTLCGDAGTGKSRLVAEFKASVESPGIRWLDGHAHAYNTTIAYSPFIDMLNRLFDIGEADAQAVVRQKIHAGVDRLLADGAETAECLVGLYAPSLAEEWAAGAEDVKSRLHRAFIALLSALAGTGPTIVCLEDLHWADPFSLALLRFLFKKAALPLLIVVSHRPPLTFTFDTMGERVSPACEPILLDDLDLSASREMVRSMLDTDTVPEALDRYLVTRVGGNPLFIEESVNTLIDTQRLVRQGKRWHFDDPFDMLDFSGTINATVHAHLDRLEPTAKAILQEAAVIGRVFRLSLLRRITAFPAAVTRAIEQMLNLGLIRRADEPGETGGPVFHFRYAIVQQVAYKGMLKKDRRAIHEKIARALETLSHDGPDRVVESVALHYTRADCIIEAADCFIRSGEKRLRRHAPAEAHGYYQRAYRLLCGIASPTVTERTLLVDLIIKWYFAFNQQGWVCELLDRRDIHAEMVRQLGDPLRAGMFDLCIGWALWRRDKATESLVYLHRSLAYGWSLKSDALIAYSSACLCRTCTDLGRMDAALAHGHQAAVVAERMEADHALIRFNLAGLGRRHFYTGDVTACWQTGEQLLAAGETMEDLWTVSEGCFLMGAARMIAGDFDQAEALLEKAITLAVHPIYALNAKYLLSCVYFFQGRIDMAARTLEVVIAAADRCGDDSVGTSANAFYGIVSAARGNLAKGTTIIRQRIRSLREHGKGNHELLFTHMLGQFYLYIARRQGTLNFRGIIKNAWFLLRTFPRAFDLAERYLLQAIELGARTQSRQRWGLACLDLGRLYAHGKKFAAARSQIVHSIDLFQGCGADGFLAEAQAALADLPP